jgi:serine/threonine protein kinase
MLFSEGTRLGPYQITAPIGAGGMGEVYKAYDTRLDRTVALKVLSETRAGDVVAQQRFTREARAIAALSHPRICPLFDVGHHDGVDFLVMEYL